MTAFPGAVWITANSTGTLFSEQLTRDADNLPSSIALTRANQNPSTLTYGYDADGNLTGSCVTGSTTIGCPSGSAVTTYTYDKVGIRLGMADAAGTLSVGVVRSGRRRALSERYPGRGHASAAPAWWFSWTIRQGCAY